MCDVYILLLKLFASVRQPDDEIKRGHGQTTSYMTVSGVHLIMHLMHPN